MHSVVTSVAGILFLSLLSLASARPPQEGPYEVDESTYPLDTLDGPFPEVVVVYPVDVLGGGNATFPFLSFAHGFSTGGPLTYPLHYSLLRNVASHGYIIGATKSCMLGCRDSPTYTQYWKEQLKVLDWAKDPSMAGDPIIGQINHDIGYGIFGHSMGGQATARSSFVAADYDIKAAVLLHPYSDARDAGAGRDVDCPLAGFTGTDDSCCGDEETRRYYDLAPVPKTLANMVGAGHLEPNKLTTRWPAYIAAFFKVWVENDEGMYHSLIYNATDPDGLCNFYEMADCIHENV